MRAGTPLEGTPIPDVTFATEDGLTLAADIFAQAGARAEVLLLHGGGQNRHSWQRIAHRLQALGMKVVAMDARGHGDSDWDSKGDYSRENLALDIRAAYRHFGLSAPLVIGASMGGLTAIDGLGLHGLPACGLVLLDVAPMTEEKGFDRIQSFMMQAPEGYESVEAVAQAVAAYRGTEPRKGPHTGLMRNLRLTPDGRYRWHWDPRMLASRRHDVETRRAHVSAVLARIDLPVLLLRGEHSDFVTQAGVDDFQTIARQGRALTIAGAGHMVSGDDNDGFLQAILDFARDRLQVAA